MEEEIGDGYVQACREADVRAARSAKRRQEEAEAAWPCKGDQVEVAKGRSNPRGLRGELFWERWESRGYHRSGVDPLRSFCRIGIRQADGSVAWDYLHDVVKVEIE